MQYLSLLPLVYASSVENRQDKVIYMEWVYLFATLKYFDRYGALQDASWRTDVYIAPPIQHICAEKSDFSHLIWICR